MGNCQSRNKIVPITEAYAVVPRFSNAPVTLNFKKSGIYNVGFGKPYKVIDVLKILFKLTNNNFSRKKIKFLTKHSGDPWGNFANISKIKKAGWTPKFNLISGAKETLKSILIK